jgi:hypothetical protein
MLAVLHALRSQVHGEENTESGLGLGIGGDENSPPVPSNTSPAGLVGSATKRRQATMSPTGNAARPAIDKHVRLKWLGQEFLRHGKA